MAWTQLRAENWGTLTSFFDMLKVGRAAGPDWMFRGQACAAWGLVPSLRRLFGGYGITYPKAHGIEYGVFRRFSGQAHMHVADRLLPPEQAPQSAWWMLMQQHSCPTRLLDWTESPYVATYFAVERMHDEDGAVWVLPGSPLDTQMTQEFGGMGALEEEASYREEKPMPAVYPIVGNKHSHRSVAQQGRYTVSTDILADHGVLVEAALTRAGWADKCLKVIVPSTLKLDFLCHLRAMNITASALFPGLDGLGRSASEYVTTRVWDELRQAM